ncbi:Multi antimicrobial extrusion protein [Sesbania bispinosa]|nr:Multi antimicrobial extrusion protein [Sesbania bispinosa]
MDTPLLSDAGAAALVAEDGDYVAVKGFKEARKVFWIETVKIWKIAVPIVFNIWCQYGINSIANMFVGHLGDLELSAVSLTNSVIGTFRQNLMVLCKTCSLAWGSATETLCGQAFGAGQVTMLGVYMQRSWVILFVTTLCLLPIYIFAAPILKLLGQQEDIADLAGDFAILVIPQFSHLPLIFQPKSLGLTGAALAFDITSWIITGTQLVYVMVWCKNEWKGLSWMAFKDIWAFVRLSLASAVMLCLEVWYMMSLIVLAGHLDNAVIAVDSLSICMNYNGWESMIFIGVNAAISVRVSNELGLRHPRAAKYSVYVTVIESLLLGILFMVIILVTKDSFAIIYTSSKTLLEAVSQLGEFLALTMVLNSVQPVISGCYYLFGLPLGYVLGYVADWGLRDFGEVEQTNERVQKWGGHAIEGDKTIASA